MQTTRELTPSPDSIAPLSIHVEHPVRKLNPEDTTRGVPTFTILFRKTNLLDDVLGKVHDRIGEGSDFSVDSVACSVGAEVDSLLALQNRSQHKGQIAIRGFDINPSAIVQAQEGKYNVRKRSANKRLEQIYLESRGFSTYTREYAFGYFVADAAPVRQGNQVEFEEANLVAEAPVVETSDLVLANNVLYHLKPHRANRFIYNAARMLNDRGILSIGDFHHEGALVTQMGGSSEDNVIRLREWLVEAAFVLDREFDLKPIAFGVGGQPTMFARK